ncbi:hypothetical protein L6452_15304 [Arctium lappa]|uniref:Uncharacterized protein n=1 Tax=Arctium lappa TaxID=4217 RepID=A0ACB9CNF7_ARCLA|nr:hypothetical protein L6452_15304 [Arctium lappa]
MLFRVIVKLLKFTTLKVLCSGFWEVIFKSSDDPTACFDHNPKITLEITDDVLATYKNQGGYDLLGRTKDQIRTTEKVNVAMIACKDLKLDGLVIIGGVISNTDVAQLAETFVEAKCST